MASITPHRQIIPAARTFVILSSPVKKVRDRSVDVSYGPDEKHPSVVYHQKLAEAIVRPTSTPTAPTTTTNSTTGAWTPLTASTLEFVKQYLTTGAGAFSLCGAIPDAAVPSTLTSSAISEMSTESCPDRVELQDFSTIFNDDPFQAAVPYAAGASTNARTCVPRGVLTEDENREIFHHVQKWYGAEARVMVGNLPAHLPNNVLSALVYDIFKEYGPCRACVFRGQGKNEHRRPYAIVQYTEHQDAAAAYYCGQEKRVGGRSVRVEFSSRA